MSGAIGSNFPQNSFKGLLVPVFTCFNNDGLLSLDTESIDKYAKSLKDKKVSVVIGTLRDLSKNDRNKVNAFTGEGPALSNSERMRNTEAWWAAVKKYDMMMMVQIGGAPLPNVLELAEHAETLGVHAVICLPELFYRPSNLEQLVGYCKFVSEHCKTRPFFYYHVPTFTQVSLDMPEFCYQAEENIPTFCGLYFTDNDLDMGIRCLNPHRVVIYGRGPLFTSAMVSGFESFAMTIFNIRTDECRAIYDALTANDVATAKRLQDQVNRDVFSRSSYGLRYGLIALMKRWFNEERCMGISAGPGRKFF